MPRSAQPLVASFVRTIFAQPDAPSSVDSTPGWSSSCGRASLTRPLLDDAAEDLLAFTSFERDHWRQIWSNNPQERLNREIRRRTG